MPVDITTAYLQTEDAPEALRILGSRLKDLTDQINSQTQVRGLTNGASLPSGMREADITVRRAGGLPTLGIAGRNGAIQEYAVHYPRAILVHSEDATVDGGASTNTFTQRKLTDIVLNERTIVRSLVTGTSGTDLGAFVLGVGTYYFDVRTCQAGAAGNGFCIKLYNVTDAADAFSAPGKVAKQTLAGNTQNQWARFTGSLTLTEETTLEVQERATANVATFGRGNQLGFSEEEIYAVVEIVRTK